MQTFLDNSRPLIQQALSEQIVAGWVRGASRAAQPLPKQPPNSPPPTGKLLDFGDEPLIHLPALDKGLANLHAKDAISASKFYDLTARARQQAFTISGDLTTGSIEKIRTAIVDNISSATSRTDWQELVREQLPALPLSDARLDTIFRAAAHGAYSDGLEDTLNDHETLDDGFPYAEFYAIHDDRSRRDHRRLEHEGLSGTNIYYRNSEVWNRIRPPLDYGCRCGWNPITIEMAAKAGVRHAQQWLASIREAEADEDYSGVQRDYMPALPPMPIPDIHQSPSWVRPEL